MLSMVRAVCLGVMTVGVAGCFSNEGVVVAKGKGDGPASQCVAGLHSELVGQPVAAAAVVPDPKRIIRPGQRVTRDYIPARTNVVLDRNDVITRIYCG